MAPRTQVKEYLALWFQLGHAAVTNGHRRRELCPQPVFQRDNSQHSDYTAEFEQAWSEILNGASEFYLEGAPIAIADLLSNAWDIIPCANCMMPIPTSLVAQGAKPCICEHLTVWPNPDLPKPRLPINDKAFLCNLCERLRTPPSQISA
ncbi:MAG: hypothetical protein AAGA67_11155 [Cyanobacteria bacterium P01_F01_bin.153]